ncbi:hypothetical protein WN48_07222 [Eufriesea mexicana]|uniref:SH3 domain-containing protein n=1 Tax=Eufriesea mexicana TaxID=516756 RepID=A0A310SNB3_9HYME|nr:hypothetical protein WN48_07222 [Eufriesea mexicana]
MLKARNWLAVELEASEYPLNVGGYLDNSLNSVRSRYPWHAGNELSQKLVHAIRGICENLEIGLTWTLIAGDLKRRHSWSSEVDYQPAETEAVATPGVDPAGLSSDDEDRGSYKTWTTGIIDIPLSVRSSGSIKYSNKASFTLLAETDFIINHENSRGVAYAADRDEVAHDYTPEPSSASPGTENAREAEPRDGKSGGVHGTWLFGADGGPGGGLSFAGSDTYVEVAVTTQIADARDARDALDAPRAAEEHGATAKHPLTPQNLFDLGTPRATATCFQQQSFGSQWERRSVKNKPEEQCYLCKGGNGDREGLSRDSKERSSKRSVKSVKEKDGGKENVDTEKREKKVLQRIEKIERTEKVEVQDKPISKEALVNERSLDSPLEKQSEKEFSGLKEAKEKEKVKRAVSEPSLVSRESTSTPSGREKHRHRRTKRSHKPRPPSRFGYEIADLDAYLTKASIEKPANIPVVLSFPSVLYQTQGGTQDEMALPLGTVVNAVFKNQTWLYVQTPHGQEGYVGYAACLPLGILPQPTRGPCWEDSTDVFPRPLGNMTDTEKLRDTRSECGARGRNPRVRRGSRDAVSACGERSVDRLYLRAAANARTKGSRHTLLVIRSDYEGQGGNALTVSKGDVVALLSDHVSDWFWVRSRDGREGFIPAVIAGHGFL